MLTKRVIKKKALPTRLSSSMQGSVGDITFFHQAQNSQTMAIRDVVVASFAILET